MPDPGSESLRFVLERAAHVDRAEDPPRLRLLRPDQRSHPAVHLGAQDIALPVERPPEPVVALLALPPYGLERQHRLHVAVHLPAPASARSPPRHALAPEHAVLALPADDRME